MKSASEHLDVLRSYPKAFLTPAQVAPVLGWDPHWIRVVARQDAGRIPFPVIVHGTRTQVPKQAFISWYEKECVGCEK